MNIIYEVTLHVETDIAAEYDVWLEQHVAEMLALPGFLGAEVWAVEDEALQPEQIARVVHYRLKDRAALDAYYRDHATHMREDGSARFGDRFHASRRILQRRPYNNGVALTFAL
jgi:antibiotic biosynthesis monooxygenase (ABM) superfamily enzyme